MFIWLLLLLLLPDTTPTAQSQKTILCLEKERQALLAFKNGLIDSRNGLSSWNITQNRDCCRWAGIHCNPKTGHVTALDLSSKIMKNISNEHLTFSLTGEIGPSLLNLSHLSYLDLSMNSFKGFPSPFFMDSLSSLRYLNLRCSFSREVILPPQMGNLTNLQYLEFGCSYPGVTIESLESISGLSSLRSLQMTGQNLSSPSNLFPTILNLPSLVNIGFDRCIVSAPSVPSNFINGSGFHSLEVIRIVGAELHSQPDFFRWLTLNRKLVDLTIRYTQSGLLDSILESIGTMTSLEHLDLSTNDLGGEIPVSWGNLCKLLTLDLSWNSLNGTLDVFKNWTQCHPQGHFLREFRAMGNQFAGPFDFTKFTSLEVLDVTRNKLNGSLSDDIFKLTNLTVLNISENAFYGILPENIGKLSNLTVLDVHSNSFQGEISDIHISKLPRLETLDLCLNSFKINWSLNFVPPFQLSTLRLCSLELGPEFPNWISTQKNLVYLDISDAGISSVAPSWLRDVCNGLEYFNISYNQVRGTAPNFPSAENVDLRSNLFEGPLPHFSPKAYFLRLSENRFTGDIHFLCAQVFTSLFILDLSNNMLSGVLPDCWSYALEILDLSSNDFHGTIPASMTILPRLVSLRLSNNSLVGELPSSFRSIDLRSLGFANNQFSGKIPAWINGSLPRLIILELQSNKISGGIPTGLCQLNEIQILDLSSNNLSGGIPTCLNNLQAMAQTINKWQTSITVEMLLIPKPWEYNILSATVTWKGKKVEYQKILGLLKLLDFSNNKLSGEIPAQLGSLIGLISLNLSRNELTGPIPPMIGQLKVLDALDLSNNRLSGRIPETISNIPRLSNLDLSNNGLSGEIPPTTQMSTFNATSFAGNPGLCGLQLEKKCHNDGNPDTSNGSSEEDEEQWYKSPWFYGSVVVGFAIGFWGLCGPLVLYAPFRHTYFRFLDRVKDSLLLSIALQMAKLKRYSH